MPEDGGGWLVLQRPPKLKPVLYVSFGATPSDVRRHFVKGRRSYIGQLELLWGHSPYASLPGVFQDESPIHWIDNTSAIAGFIKGYAKPMDSARIFQAQAATCVALRCSPFYFYVRSKANIADLPSRFAVSELLAVIARLQLGANIVCVDPVFPDLASWRLSARAWLAQLGLRREVRTLADLRGQWRHLVSHVGSAGWRAAGGVYDYVGRCADLVTMQAIGREGRAAAHEASVREYAAWLARDGAKQAWLRVRMRARLRGKLLVCHCARRGLPCHAEIIAVVANTDVELTVLSAGGATPGS